ncbi:MAG: sugar transferase [Bacilli bacterium]|nr:sugar transferase [Bacilli bacterium]
MNGEAVVLEHTETKSISLIIYKIIKRLFDIICSLVGLVFIIPIAIIIKICYMCTGDFSSIFYTQKRVGKNGKAFRLFKFRSMVKNADKKLEVYLNENKEAKKEWDKYQKLSNDPRITKVGRIIRKLSIDEVPQFINVLKGDMSMIGPRPLIIGELDAHNGDHSIYEAVKPGITGWWACNGRSDVEEYDERLKLEYYYIQHRGIKMDIKCIFKTITSVLSSKGAK